MSGRSLEGVSWQDKILIVSKIYKCKVGECAFSYFFYAHVTMEIPGKTR